MTNPTNAPKGANAPSLPATDSRSDPITPSGRCIAHLDVPTLRNCADSYRREADHLAGLGAEEAARNLIQAADEHEARAAELEASRLLTDTPSGPNTNGAGSRVIPACVNGMPKRGVRPGAHPDIELLFAWDSFVAAAVAYQCAPNGETNRYCEMVDSIGERIEAFIPKTLEGTEIKLLYALTKYIDADCAWNTLVFGDDPDQDFRDIVDNDPHAGMLWNMIRPGDRLVDRMDRRRREQSTKGPGHSSSPSA